MKHSNGGKQRIWTNADLLHALYEVLVLKKPKTVTASKYKIPYNSLVAYVNGKYKLPPPDSELSSQQAQALQNVLQQLQYQQQHQNPSIPMPPLSAIQVYPHIYEDVNQIVEQRFGKKK